MMEAIRVLDNIPKLLDVGRAENRLRRVYSLIAEPTKWAEKCSRREVLRTCDTENASTCE